MKNPSKLTSQFFMSLLFLSSGLLKFATALSKSGRDNGFVADNWSIPIIVLLPIVFGLGWWYESLTEQLVLFKRRKAARVAFFGLVLIFCLLVLGPKFVFEPLGFLQSAMGASGFFLVSGFFLRYSVANPEVIAKLREPN